MRDRFSLERKTTFKLCVVMALVVALIGVMIQVQKCKDARTAVNETAVETEAEGEGE